jgi:hypothetical protein
LRDCLGKYLNVTIVRGIAIRSVMLDEYSCEDCSRVVCEKITLQK